MTKSNVRFLRIPIARICSSLFIALERFDALHICHATVAELLLHIPMCTCFVDTMASSTSHPSSALSISKSEFVMPLCGFFTMNRCFLTSCGHVMCHTVGLGFVSPGSQTPPAPSPGAFTVPVKSSLPRTSSFVFVGFRPYSRSSCRQTHSASCALGHLFQKTRAGFMAMGQLIGPNKFFLTGMSMAECRSFLSSFSGRLNSTPLLILTFFELIKKCLLMLLC